MSRTLKQVKCGETVTVRRLQGEGPVKRRIMDMGITKGVEIHIRKVAPLGDPGICAQGGPSGRPGGGHGAGL